MRTTKRAIKKVEKLLMKSQMILIKAERQFIDHSEKENIYKVKHHIQEGIVELRTTFSNIFN